MLANHDRQRSEPCNFPPMFQFNSVPSISTIDRKIVSIRERRIFRITNEGGEASSEFYIPFETNTSTFLYIYIYISWQNRSVNGVDERLENEVKRGISQAEGNNPSEGGHKYRLGGAQNALGVFGTRGLWRYRNNRWPRFATVTPRKPRATFRAYHPDLWIKKRRSPLLPSISTVFARGEKNDSRPVRGFNEAAPPPLPRSPFYLQYPRGKGGEPANSRPSNCLSISPSFHSFHFEFSRLFSINWKNIPSLYPQNIIQKQERARLVSRREDCKRADTRWFRFGIQNARYAGTGRKPVVRLMRRLVDNSLQ